MIDPVAVRLSRPLTAIDQTFVELKVREPTGDDLIRAGYPLRFADNGTTEVDAAAMSRLIGVCAGIPSTSVASMPARDWQQICLVLMSFFAPPAIPPASSEDTSSSRAGGATN
jgi:hypothetical protein